MSRIPYGRKGCFVRGTRVSTPDGEVPIETLKIGDTVLSFDDKGEIQESLITDLIHHESVEVWKYQFWGGFSVEATPTHWILNQYNAFAAIGSLEKEDCAVNHNDHLVPLLSTTRCNDQEVFNLSVEPNHTYIANGLRVHNGGLGNDKRTLTNSKTPRGRKGGKGGGGATRPAREAPNTLQSKAVASLLDVLSEGEIKGLVNDEQSIYFDETALRNENGDYNFKEVTWDIRYGLTDQLYMKGFPAVEAEKQVELLVSHASPITRTVTNPALTSLRVTIRLPSLIKQNKNTGDVNGYTQKVQIQVADALGVFETVVDDTITGKTSSPWNKSYRFSLTGNAPWDIKVIKVSADAPDLSIQNDLYWSSYTEIIDHKLIYPDTAYIGMSVDSVSFDGRVPARSYEIYGIICKVPTNYDPETKTYSGIWDGSFKRAWTDNNAWILYDILTTSRYWGDGSEIFGSVITEDQVEKYSFYEAGVYCDELIPDGDGGMEPRFTFNAAIFEREEAFNVIQAIASSFRAMVFWSRGQVYVAVDRPGDAVKLVSEANVWNGQITYQGSALKTRHTQAVVSWNDPNDGYHAAIEVYENQEKQRKYGRNTSETVAYGCTRRSQAWRWGAWLVETEWAETQTATYEATFDQADVMPGELIKIADRNIAGVRYGGRVVAATLSSITLDDQVELMSGETYTISVMMPDNSIKDRVVLNTPGLTNLILLDSDLPDIPNDFCMWLLASNSVNPRMFRVIGVIENENHRFEVTALLHDPTKYDRIEQNINLSQSSYTNIPTGAIVAPTNLVIKEKLYLEGSSVKSAAEVSWTPSTDSRVSFYEVHVKTPDVAFLSYGDTAQNNLTVIDTTEGNWGFRVRSVSGAGVVSPWVTIDPQYLAALSAPPADIDSFSLNTVGTTTYLDWTIPTDLNVKNYVIKFAPLLGGATWAASSVLVDSISNSLTSIAVPSLVGSYLIKAISYNDVESANATVVISNIAAIENLNVVFAFDEAPLWLGTRTDVLIDDLDRLYLDNDSDISVDWPDVSLVSDISDGELVDEGIYEFYNYLDLGQVFTSRVTPNIHVIGLDLNAATVDEWLDVSLIEDWASTSSSGYEIQLQIATSQVAHPAGYGAWQDFVVGDYTCQSMKFRLILISTNPTVTPVVDSAFITIDMPDRIDARNNVSCGVSGLTITYTPAFKETPSFVITASTMATGDYYVLTGETAAGVTIQFFNSSNVAIARTFNWVAKGWGYVN